MMYYECKLCKTSHSDVSKMMWFIITFQKGVERGKASPRSQRNIAFVEWQRKQSYHFWIFFPISLKCCNQLNHLCCCLNWLLGKQRTLILLFSHLCLLLHVLCCAVLSRSVVSDSATLWTAVCQASLSMGLLQARMLEWVAILSSRGSSQPRNQAHVSRLTGGFFTIWATREALIIT